MIRRQLIRINVSIEAILRNTFALELDSNTGISKLLAVSAR